jgi:hypothetical protein
MDLPALFQRLVIGTTALYALWLALPWIEVGLVSAEVADALSWYGFDAVLPWPAAIAWFVALLYLPVAAGLYRFSPSARRLFVALTIVVQVWSLLGGLHVETPLGATLGSLVTLGDGAIIALAFASPLRERFRISERVG